MNEEGLLPSTTKNQIRKSLAGCQSCIRITEYLRAIGSPDQETEDRANHLAKLAQAALELDRQASQQR